MRNKLMAVGYNGIIDTEGNLSPNAQPHDYVIHEVMQSNQAKVKKEKEAVVVTKHKRILRVYDQIIVVMTLFALFAIFTATTGKVLDKFGSILLLLLSVAGIYAFADDKKRWRNHSESKYH